MALAKSIPMTQNTLQMVVEDLNASFGLPFLPYNLPSYSVLPALANTIPMDQIDLCLIAEVLDASVGASSLPKKPFFRELATASRQINPTEAEQSGLRRSAMPYNLYSCTVLLELAKSIPMTQNDLHLVAEVLNTSVGGSFPPYNLSL
jgi:hypothetical protein